MSITRIMLALLLIAAVTLVVVSLCAVPSASAAGPETQGQPTCAACHGEVTKAWMGGKHAEKGVACEACHKPGAGAHPGYPIGVDKSADQCGTCHSAALNEWQTSSHGRVNVACSSCHDMHSAALKFGTPSDLCAGCHKERANPTDMPMAGATNACVGCHMHSTTSNKAGGGARTNHSFVMAADACQSCHKDNAHSSHQIVSTDMPKPGTDKPVQQPAPTATLAPAPDKSNGASAWPNILGGMLGGLLLGFIAAVVVIRR